MFCAWYDTYVVKGTQGPDIGARVKEAREALGLSQVALAEHLDAGERTVQAWERNERTPRLDSLMRISSLSGHPVSWFYEQPEEAAA